MTFTHKLPHQLIEMLSFRRPAFSVHEEAFIDKYIRVLNPIEDKFGNLILDVGIKPNIIWSSHTDTVHTDSGFQALRLDKKTNIVTVADTKVSNCLGADCTTGVYIMLKMIEGNVSGRYIFHRDEEAGGKGSKYIAANTPEVVKGIDVAIAFDRKGYNDIITHQGGQTASNEFARSLALQFLGMSYQPSTLGTFTDTKSYAHLVAECTNISVGYFGAHSSNESQDLSFVDRLVAKLLDFDTSGLVVKRTPAVPVQTYYTGQTYGGTGYRSPFASTKTPIGEETTIRDLVENYPVSISAILAEMGFDFDSLDQAIFETQQANNKRNDAPAKSLVPVVKELPARGLPMASPVAQQNKRMGIKSHLTQKLKKIMN